MNSNDYTGHGGDTIYNDSLFNDWSNVFTSDETKKFSEKISPSKQTPTKKLGMESKEMFHAPSDCHEHPYRTTPRMINSYRLGFDCKNVHNKLEYRTNIEKYCLNFNPYSSKHYF